ncbi:MAG: HAMP domain-containing protein [Erysipelotrichales bacterium]|nr:HAMP domain-containing protein [Erysipelotrichales bacterium]
MAIKLKKPSKKAMGIATKLSASVALSAFLSISVLAVASVYFSGLNIQVATRAELTALAEKNAVTFRDEIIGPVEEASNFAEYFVEHYDSTSPATVQSTAFPEKLLNTSNANLEFYFNGLAYEVVKNNPIVMGFSLFLEDGVMGSNYDYYRNQYYASIVNVDNHTIPDYYFDESAYNEAKTTKNLSLSNPTAEGQNVYVITYYPIYDGNKFLGAVQVSFNLAYFNELNTINDVHETVYSTLILGDGTVLYSSPGTSTVPGSNYGDVYSNIADFNGAVTTFSKGEVARVASDGYTEYFYPIEIGNQTWASITGIEDDELNAPVFQIIQIILVFAVGGIVVMIMGVVITVRMMLKPIDGVVEATEKLANGNLDCEITVTTDDEIGRMGHAFNSAIVSLRKVVNDVDYILNELAEKNFNVNFDQEYVGDFNSIGESMKHITVALNETLAQIKMAGEQVNNGADQVASASQSLAQGATEQAASVEELSATVNDIYEQVRMNTENSRVAAEKVNEAGNEIESSNTQMNELMRAMEDITAKSNEISKIVKTIDDIAFQTNILALNAAVEAARAGAAGKGFAVVADEVRNLASKSAEAAKNTTMLIEQTTEAIANGSAIAGKTATALREVVTTTEEAVELVNQISEASEAQSSAISQVTMGIEQISAVVQTNSATSEESAAASEELSGQAKMLDELLSEFILKD